MKTREDFVKRNKEIIDKIANACKEFKELREEWEKYEWKDEEPLLLIVSGTVLANDPENSDQMECLCGNVVEFTAALSRENPFGHIIRKSFEISKSYRKSINK